VVWANDVFGTRFGAQTLALTSRFVRLEVGTAAGTEVGTATTTEVDVLFNTAQQFNCYRGAPAPERPEGSDLQRVALHAFGHVLGLDHPDQATPPHRVAPVMSPVLGATDMLQVDDIQGALRLFDDAATVALPSRPAELDLPGPPRHLVVFPPRDETLGFFLRLEDEYRVTLGRQRNNQGFVDPEGSAVWFPEWLRYVLNECSVTDASDRVLMQIRGQGIQPVCGMAAPGTIDFPPRNQSLDFLTTLDSFYRTELNRTVELTYTDLEGKAVWLQEYLRYRVNGCNDDQASDRVLDQIRGGEIAPVCECPPGTAGCPLPSDMQTRYIAIFESDWSESTHPEAFPFNPHFSPMIGATHRSTTSFWQPGMLASEGIKRMAEEGSQSPLDGEIAAAQASGEAEFLFRGGGLSPTPGLETVEFDVTSAFPYVTLVTMVAPSPDWFVGVSGLPLIANGEWRSEVVIDLRPWDAGTDSGEIYDSVDADTVPPAPISALEGAPVLVNGSVPPFGRFIFRRLP
jgi:hypothetical protein